MGRRAAGVFGEPERPAWSRMILALATNVRHSATIDRYAGRKFERASERNWPPVRDSTQSHSPTVASRPRHVSLQDPFPLTVSSRAGKLRRLHILVRRPTEA